VSKIDLALLAGGAFAIFLIIRGAGGFLSNLKLPFSDIKFPDFKFPDINFPDFTLPEINLGGFNIFDPNQESLVEEGLVDPIDDTFGTTTDPLDLNEGKMIPDTTGGRADRLRNVIGDDLDSLVQQLNVSTPPERSIDQLGRGGFQGIAQEAPLGALSLSRIIERFGVSASQAVNIRSMARNDFGDFDFGTNTGSGIGSVTTSPEINTLLRSNESNVSNSIFQGLSVTEIARRLTGGNISNF
jgi:hypothetical protein